VPTGTPTPPDASEAGWKDTAPVGPNEILRVIARFEDYAGAYPYHCHIIEHEDNEMMRQFESVPAPLLSIGDVTVSEGNAGTTQASFLVTLSAPVQAEVRVVVFTEDGTATGGSDYTPVPADTLVFPPMTTLQNVLVPLLGDGTVEPDETFRVRLTAANVAVLGDSVGLGTIANDDGVPMATVNDVAVIEGNAGSTNATFTVTLSAPSAISVRIVALTEDSTAIGGLDFIPVGPDTIVFPPLVTTQPLVVPLLGELLGETDEVFHVRLASALGAVIADSIGRGTILNDDATTDAPGDTPVRASYLAPGYPNPASGPVTLRWGLRAPGRAELVVFDIHGRLVRRFANDQESAGHRTLVWDGRDVDGRRVSSGVYEVQLKTGGQTFRRAVVIMR